MTYQCDHKLIPIVYGHMSAETISKSDTGDIVYGGLRKSAGSADWFCLNCLEDIQDY